MLSQIIWAVECLFTAFVGAMVFLFWLMAELMSPAMLGSGEDLRNGDKRHDFILNFAGGFSPLYIQGVDRHELACPS